MSKQWDLYAEATAGRVQDILRHIEDAPSSPFIDQTARGITMAVRSDGPAPKWLTELRDQLVARGIVCTLR